MQRTLAGLILLLAASPLWGQITLAPQFSLGQRIVATTPAEAKAYDWSCPTADLLTDGGNCFVWAKPGKHVLTLITVDTEYTIRRFEKTFEVSDSSVPPTPATLRELVTDSEATKIADYLRALASQVSKISSTEQFWSVWQQTFPVSGNVKLDAALKARLDPALAAQKGLSVELLALADEFAKESPQPPVPNVAPIPEPGLNVLIIEETADRLELPAGQRDIITATDWRTKWQAKGGEIRVRDPSDPQPNDLAKWNTAMSRPRSGLPWVIISNGQTGYEGPLPESLTEWEALLAKYGG